MAERGLLYQGPTLDDRAYGLLGADPGLSYRGTVLPFGREQDGSLTLAWPGAALSLARSLTLPKHASEGGDFSVNDTTEMGLNVGLLGSAAPAPKGALRMGSFTLDYYGSPVKIFENPTPKELAGLAGKTKFKALRRIVDPETNTTYVWDAADPALHALVAEQLGIKVGPDTIMDMVGLD